jgi:signal transduction histidine kinase
MTAAAAEPTPSSIFPGAAGHTGALLLSTDWSRTPLGAMAQWPRSLLGYVAMIMAMPTPAIIFWGPEQTQIYNDGYAAIMGPRHPRFFGGAYRESWPDTYPLIYPHMRRVLDLGETWQVERAHIPVTRHGFDEEAYFSFTFSALRDDEGRIAGILQPVFDVSESVLGDRRAQTLRRLVGEHRAGATPLDDAFAAMARNPGDLPFARAWLWEPGEQRLLLAGHVGEIPADDELARLAAAAQLALHGDAVEVPALAHGRWQVTQLLALAGDPGKPALGVIALGVSARLRFDRPYREFLLLVARQVAAGLQRARAQQAEARHRQYLDELFLQAPAGIAVTQGPNHVFELVNPAYDALTGHRGLKGCPVRDALPEMRDQAFPALLDEVYRTGRPLVGTEAAALLRRGVHGEEEEAFFNFVYQPLRDEHGVTNGILVFSYEVTDQVRARRRAEGLADELREEQRRKDDFLAMLAHELRNPLSPISAAAQVIRLSAVDDDRLRRTADIVARQVAHMTSLVDDLLDASRVTRGIVTIDHLPQDLRSILATAVEQARPLVDQRRHRLVLDVQDTDIVVTGDRKRLVQVVANLLDNAAKYSPDGGEIRLGLHAGDGAAVLQVADRGAGIPSALQPHVFDLFVQGARSSDRAQGGLGIGLALVRSLVELHDGRVRCDSAGAGLGTCFTVHLPLAAPQPARPGSSADPARHPDPTHGRHGVRRRVLIVDDNADAAHMLAMLVEAAGHESLVEHHPLAALRRAVAEAPDTCLLDIGLPEIDGHELARRLRGLPETASALLVAVTGYGQATDRQQAIDAGFDHFFVKPPDPQALTALLAGSGASGT